MSDQVIPMPEWAPVDGPWCLKQWLPLTSTSPVKYDICLRPLHHEGHCRTLHNDWQHPGISRILGQVSVPKVINKRHSRETDSTVYIGRNSKWGNHYIIGLDGDRETVVRKHKEWLDSCIAEDPRLLDEIKHELSGKDLACWCAPLACHGDYLLELANKE